MALAFVPGDGCFGPFGGHFAGQGVVAHPEGQSLFRLARHLLAEGPPSLQGVAVGVLGGLSRQRVQGWGKG